MDHKDSKKHRTEATRRTEQETAGGATEAARRIKITTRRAAKRTGRATKTYGRASTGAS